jgi:hypothetical protein
VEKSANSGANEPFLDDIGDLAPRSGSNKSRGANSTNDKFVYLRELT